MKKLDNYTREQLARILSYVMANEESSFEETIDEFGIESLEAEDHIYSLARNLWAEFALDYSEGVNA